RMLDHILFNASLNKPFSYRSRIWAVSVGINNYPTEPLRFSVRDADEYEKFLVSTGLTVKKITSLRNEKATRKAILEALEALLEEDLRPEDLVHFYFAGHGSKAKAPAGWHTEDGKMEMLMAHDFDRNFTKGRGGILDLEVGDIFRRIDEKKGGLIGTVFLDCCNSGSGTRSDNSSGARVRGFNMEDYTIPADALRGLKLNPRSHILLAACEKNQKAFESGGKISHGYFTHVVLDIMKNADPNTLTYSDLIKRWAPYEFDPGQTPRIEGLYDDLIAFTNQRAPKSPLIYDMKHTSEGFKLQAGSASGITKGAKFSVHTDNQRISESRVGEVVAVTVQPSTTLCSPFPEGSDLRRDVPLYAIQTLRGNPLKLFIDPKDAHYRDWTAIVKENSDDLRIASIRLVEPNEEADLAITTVGNSARFEYRHERCRRQYGLQHLTGQNAQADDKKHMLQVLCSAAHFFYYLDPDNVHDPPDDIDVVCHLVKKITSSKEEIKNPNPRNLNINNIIRLPFDDDAESVICTFEIKNKNRSISYHVEAFMFDDNLKITKYDYPVKTHISPHHPSEPNLPAGQSLKFDGSGESGPARKISLFSSASDLAEVGFLKVYYSTKPIELGYIAQETPFKMGGTRGDQGPAPMDRELFFSITIPVLMGRVSVLEDNGMP
ncbi:hypothetical protein H0H93_008018, partial [Arthromyces matolae]